MQKIFSIIGDNTYLVGFSSSLESFLDSLGNEISTVQMLHTNRARCYHHGQKMEIVYFAVTINQNERCFYKAV